MRSLLHSATGGLAAATFAPNSDHPHDDHDHHDGHGLPLSMALRVGAIFAILAAGLLGGLPPILLRQFRASDAAPARLARAFGGGVILSLALIHVLPEASESLEVLTPFPLGAVLAIAGILTLLAIDYSVTSLLAPEPFKSQLRAAVRLSRAPPPAAITEKAAALDSEAAAPADAGGEGAAANAEDGCRGCAAATATAAGVVGHAAPLLHSHHHSAGHPIATLRQLVACYTLEAGCVFHSVIIGIGIGTMVDNTAALPPLIIAMVFHQALEAVALGAVLAAALIPMAKKILMLVVYSLTMPIGIAIGIAVAASYDPSSPVAAGVQGALSAFSAGLLLHIGMFQLIGEEASRHDLLVRPQLAAALAAALVLGVAGMAVIALWG